MIRIRFFQGNIMTVHSSNAVLAVLLLAASAAHAEIYPERPQASNTQRMDMPAGGELRAANSFGEFTVEGWDRPEIEITVVKTARVNKHQDAAALFDKVKVTARREGNATVIDTSVPRRNWLSHMVEGDLPVDLEYRVKVPFDTRLQIDHLRGEVHVAKIGGDLHITDKNGHVTAYLAANATPAIDASSNTGEVQSDFEGKETSRRLKLGHTFMRDNTGTGQKLFLRTGFGDITILKVSLPRVGMARPK